MISHRWQKNNGRFYKVLLSKDMLDEWVLTVVWGSIYSRLGNHKHVMFKSLDEANIHINEISERRLKRGYELVAQNRDNELML